MPSRIGGVLLTSLPATVNGKTVDIHNIGKYTYTPVAKYPSSSSSDEYCVCEISDGTVSCDCKGWTRRAPPTGRTCKHTEDWINYLCMDKSKKPAQSASVVAVPDIRPIQESANTRGGSLEEIFSRIEKSTSHA